MSSSTYQDFLCRVREIYNTRAVEALLEWDQETYMPRKGAGSRADQRAMLAGLAHEKLTSDELSGALASLEASAPAIDHAMTTNVREMRRNVDRARKLPRQLVEELARVTTLAQEAWATARRDSNYALFAPHFERILDLKREVACCLGWTTEPYDTLLDEYEPGGRASEIQAVFDNLKAELVPLVQALVASPRQPDRGILERVCPVDSQVRFNRKIAEALCFDFEAGRIDVSTHPFCTSFSPLDVRITTRYNERYMPTSLFGIMHETGHALYEQGLDAEHAATPMGQPISMGIHESQSRLWENLVGRARPFWEHHFPALQREFPSLADVTLDEWHFAINAVQPSLIRVEADEVTYGLHIILRFDLERKLISGKLSVRDVPAAWNEGMRSLLGITPPNDGQGCLQDIHWSWGLFGYFPTYQLGNLYASQFFAAARQALPDLDAQIRRGELRPLREWLRENIHQHGKRFRADELLKQVTGQALSAKPYMAELRQKFGALYGVRA